MPAAPAHPRPGGRSLVARLVLGSGALAGLVYATWAWTLRRAAFADHESRTVRQLESSDRADAVLLVVCGVAVLAGLAYWLLTRTGPAGVLDICALTAFGLAVVTAGVGTYFLLTWDTDVGRAVTGLYALGGGFALSSGALIVALVSPRATVVER